MITMIMMIKITIITARTKTIIRIIIIIKSIDITLKLLYKHITSVYE